VPPRHWLDPSRHTPCDVREISDLTRLRAPRVREDEGEAMDPKNKFAADTVRQLPQSLDGVAPYQETELSKQQAIRTLSP
jgi:hypothetical protein